jgi:hypothetical protein
MLHISIFGKGAFFVNTGSWLSPYLRYPDILSLSENIPLDGSRHSI